MKIGSYQDSEFSSGMVGVFVSGLDVKGPEVLFENLKVTVPDPANPPGGLLAPTVVPTVAITPIAPPPAGCRLTGYSLEVLGGGAIVIHYSADGFAPGENVLASAIGTGSDGNTVKLRKNVQADGQGHIEGELGALPTAVDAITVSWAFNLEGLTGGCMIDRSANPQG